MPKPDSKPSALAAKNLHKHYRVGSEDLHVLRGASIAVEQGEWLAIVGASGSGKSTMLHLMGALDTPDRGKVVFNGTNVFDLSANDMNRYRNQQVGFVFQFYHLLPELTALENVCISAMIGSGPLAWPGIRRQRFDRAHELLEDLGLADRVKHRPSKLSGGERQRVAIARALMNNPAVLLADEPTGNLDDATGRQILEVFQRFHARGQTIVMVTHDQSVAAAADRRLRLDAGRLKS